MLLGEVNEICLGETVVIISLWVRTAIGIVENIRNNISSHLKNKANDFRLFPLLFMS